ncbi:zinc finger and BTB domain-containing protein 11 [Anolis carolinensis]|uniref:Zinc finger and BTB domain containing 11 n=1 Tax=Anolis carolinensis TaxID=28377 RepID=R4GAP1_ANOCA|nr:PREDICTED: zinc finger and BTB domain-containing protein 11 [Anolis carolinensis]|eukprot:XP_003219226.1 PREDICTED: zinc finger and BTB domain-containing protein 11 [Anolis carolinensis]
MSSEESYLAILRYLTNEREPYAPGTEGNAKRKIRKAAACYVVRGGVLYYQRRQRDQQRFAELEVVLQAERRARLIRAAHLEPGGAHRTRLQTWQRLSRRFWWRGILKQVKDYIKECSKCQEKLDRSRSLSDPSEMLEELGLDVMSHEDSNETDDEISNPAPIPAASPKPVKKKPIAKHELVFVDSKGLVKQSSPKHCQSVLNQLNQQRLSNQFCDVTLLIEGEVHKAHKSILAANSEYFRELFIEKGAVSSHEAVVDLSGFRKASFLPLLEFAYTSELIFDFCNMAAVAELAQHLLMTEVLEICEIVHKQMEDKQITVYQKGDVQVVEVAQNLLESSEHEETPLDRTEQPFSIEEAVATVNGTYSSSEMEAEATAEAEAQTASEAIVEDPPEPPVQSPRTETTESETTENKGNADETMECTTDQNIPIVQPEPTAVDQEVISTPTECDPDENVNNEQIKKDEANTQAAEIPEISEESQEGLKKKRGRPCKMQSISQSQLETSISSQDDTYKSKLRQRSVTEGDYIRLHKGIEKKLQNRKPAPKSAIQQVAMKLVQRGRKMKQPKRDTTEHSEKEAQHKCHECGVIFQRRYALIMHTLKHERTKNYKCPLCKKEFQYGASLRAHLVRHTRKNEVTVATASIEESGGAVKGRTKREFICDICGRSLPKLYSLRIHMLKHTGVKPHACKICGKSFTYKHGLKMHLALHEAQKQFKCELCDKSFVTKRSLQEHISIHTGESKYICSQCGKPFYRASGLSKHIKKHQPKPNIRGYQCTQCEKSFYEPRDLRQHMNKHLGVKPFQCQFCGKCYSWKKDWYSHVKSHSVTDPYRCNVCGKEFYEKALYRRHVKKATHGKKGRAKQNLERVCEHCGRKFTQLREYRRHMNNHEGVKPFECLTCGVAWADARSLKRHVRSHTGERPYVCPVCNEAYIDARTLRKHMTKFHRDYVPCKIMLEKDTLQFHNQGTQVEHAISILTSDAAEQEAEVCSEDIETVVMTEETLDTVAATEECTTVSTLSDQSIMQVVNYVLAQQGQKMTEVTEAIQTVEVEVEHVSDQD